jgi:hypothetical protein
MGGDNVLQRWSRNLEWRRAWAKGILQGPLDMLRTVEGRRLRVLLGEAMLNSNKLVRLELRFHFGHAFTAKTHSTDALGVTTSQLCRLNTYCNGGSLEGQLSCSPIQHNIET